MKTKFQPVLIPGLAFSAFGLWIVIAAAQAIDKYPTALWIGIAILIIGVLYTGWIWGRIDAANEKYQQMLKDEARQNECKQIKQRYSL